MLKEADRKIVILGGKPRGKGSEVTSSYKKLTREKGTIMDRD